MTVEDVKTRLLKSPGFYEMPEGRRPNRPLQIRKRLLFAFESKRRGLFCFKQLNSTKEAKMGMINNKTKSFFIFLDKAGSIMIKTIQ